MKTLNKSSSAASLAPRKLESHNSTAQLAAAPSQQTTASTETEDSRSSCLTPSLGIVQDTAPMNHDINDICNLKRGDEHKYAQFELGVALHLHSFHARHLGWCRGHPAQQRQGLRKAGSGGDVLRLPCRLSGAQMFTPLVQHSGVLCPLFTSLPHKFAHAWYGS